MFEVARFSKIGVESLLLICTDEFYAFPGNVRRPGPWEKGCG